MRPRNFGPLVSLLILAFISGGAAAVPTNPLPGVFGDDIGDTGLFSHGDLVIGLELAGLSEPLGSFELGFYFEGDSGSLFTIFSVADSTAAGDQTAAIDFTTGLVFDLDEGVVETDFSAAADLTADVGFYLLLPGPVPLFTQPELNGGVDVAGTFPIIGGTGFLIGFDFPGSGVGPLAFEIVDGVTPVLAVPTPNVLALLLVGLGFMMRRRPSAHW